MENTKAHEKLTNLAALAVFGVFAVCLLLVVLTGAQVYQGITDRGEIAYQSRTAVRYLTARVQQSDFTDALSVEPFGDTQALVFREKLDGHIRPMDDHWILPADTRQVSEELYRAAGRSMDQAILRLYRDGKTTRETALRYADHPEQLRRSMG